MGKICCMFPCSSDDGDCVCFGEQACKDFSKHGLGGIYPPGSEMIYT